MKKLITLTLLAATMLLVLALPAPAAAEEQTIVEIAVADGRFTTLVAAVTAAGLADDLSAGEWTVFAPTDDAFAKLGLNADNIATTFTPAELTDILLYHVLTSEVFSDKALTLLGDVTMANGQQAGLKFFDGTLYVNDNIQVIIADINASNGAIHAIDSVMLGPWPKEAPAVGGGDTGSAALTTGNSIVDIAVADGRFTTLVAAVTAAGLVDALSSGEWTVFAPTDDAFAKLGLDADNIASVFTPAELSDILLYHVLTSEVFSDKALTLLGDVTMGNGQQAGLKFFDGTLFINDDIQVIIADINADNGAIHAIDSVMLGPWPKVD